MRNPSSFQKSFLPLALVLAILLTAALPAMGAETVSDAASTIQLMKTEGSVSVTNGSGRALSVFEDMRLYNGYHAKTAEKSYAWASLDSSKLIKLDAVSKAGLRKSGRNLEILLHSGNLLFNVTEPLEDDESMNIRTSTMVVGVRGTCGWVKAIDQWTTVLYILEGSVTCSVTDPVTGEVKTEVVTGGPRATCVVYPQDQAGSKCDIILDQFEEGDVDGFVLVDAVPDGPLCEKIYADSGLDLRDWTGDPQDRLEQDDEQQGGDAEEDLRQTHEQLVQPPGGQSADRAEQRRQGGGDSRGQKADQQGDAPAVPDHGEDVPPHGVGAEPEGGARRLRRAEQVHVGRVLGNKQLAAQTAQDDHRQRNHSRDGLPLMPRPFYRRGRQGRPGACEGKSFIHGPPPPPAPRSASGGRSAR